MDDSLGDKAMLWFFGSLLAGPLAGALLGWKKGLTAGLALGCLLIGSAGFATAGAYAWSRWHLVHQTAPISGKLIEFRGNGPVVGYTGPDGVARQTRGLGGSLRDHQPGDAVMLRLDPHDPAHALVNDFQNLWAGTWAMGLFGLFPTLAGLFFVLGAFAEDAPSSYRRPPEPTPSQQRWRQRTALTANLLMVGGFVAMFYPPQALVRSLGQGFMVIGLGACVHGIGLGLAPANGPLPSFGAALVGVVLLYFGWGAWMLGAG